MKPCNRTPSARPDDVKQALADTAYRLFREQGFDQVGIRDITAALGMTTGAFYYYFKNKAELLEYHASGKSLWLKEKVPALLAGLSPREKILQLLAGYLCDIFLEEGYELCEDRMFIKYYSRRESPHLVEVLTACTEEYLQSLDLNGLVTTADVVQDLLIAFRGVEYDWCMHQGRYDLHAKMRRQLSIVLGYYDVIKLNQN